MRSILFRLLRGIERGGGETFFRTSRGWILEDGISLESHFSRGHGRPNITFDRTAGSHSLAAAGQRARWAAPWPSYGWGAWMRVESSEETA